MLSSSCHAGDGSQAGLYDLRRLLQAKAFGAAVTSQPLGPARWLATVPSPWLWPERGLNSCGSDVPSACRGGSSSHSSTMAGQSFSRLLQLSVLLLLAGRLDPCSRLEGDAVLPEELEQQLVAPETSSWDGLELLSWTCSALNTLLSGVLLARWLGRRLRRRRGEVRDGSWGQEPPKPWAKVVSGQA